VDNTLLDNDRVQRDLYHHLARSYGLRSRLYIAIFEEFRKEIGYADYLGALERYGTASLHSRYSILRCGVRTYGRSRLRDQGQTMRKHVLLAIVLLTLAAASSAQNDISTIIVQRSVEANANDWKAAPDYDYFERDRQPGGGTKTYQELMILGSPYERLVAVNGKALAAEQQSHEQQKLDSTIVQRRNESQRQRAERIAKYERDRKRDQLLMEQLTKALDFVLVGQQKLDGYDVYVLKATPRGNYQPPNMETEVLKGMQGKLWIDTQTFQWVKVEAQVIRPVSIEGFLAEVEPGTRFELEKMPVEDGIWLPKHFAMKSQAKVLFFFTHKSQADETYYGYHKTTPIQAAAVEE
jgi:hypothetical protein